jgi:hypothetical protein
VQRVEALFSVRLEGTQARQHQRTPTTCTLV